MSSEINELFSHYTDPATRNAFARNNLIVEYDNDCPHHGVTDHCAGKCVICYPRDAARHRLNATFVGNCATCGPGYHSLSHGRCLTCYTKAGVRRVGRSPRAVARASGSTSYLDTCVKHGQTAHGVQSGKCLTCFNSMGLRRPAAPVGDPLRIAARAAGAASYLSWCSLHGGVPHSTTRGKCLTCFNSLGYPRPGARQRP